MNTSTFRFALGRSQRSAAWFCSIVLTGITASFALWNPLESYEHEHLCRTTVQSMESLRADIKSDMQVRLLAQARLAELWSDHVSFSQRDRELSARLFLDHHPGYVGLEWFDSTQHILWALSRDRKSDPAVLARAALVPWPMVRPAISTGLANGIVTSRFEFEDGRPALRIALPVVRSGVVAGYLAAIVDVPATLDSLVDDHRDLGYSVSVVEGTTEIYRMPGSLADYEDTLTEAGPLQVPGANWTVRVWPKPQILSTWQSSLPKVALILGGLLGSVLMLTIHFSRAAQTSSRELQQAHDRLEERVKERTVQLEEVNGALKSEVSDRKRAENSYRNLSGRLLRLQDEERRRIARDLHDSTAQMLGALAINVDRSLALVHAGDFNRLDHVLTESGQFVEEVTQEIRTVSYLLHPPMLDDLGLEYVLPWYTSGFSRRSGIETTLAVQPGLGRLPREVELTLFRIVQESLTNVHRHSGSPRVAITLSRTDDTTALEVRDEGAGLPEQVLEAVRGGSGSAPVGVGIAGMRERVRQLGGRMEVNSGTDGAVLRAALPLTLPETLEGVAASCCTSCHCPVCGPGATGEGLSGVIELLDRRNQGDAAA